MDIRKAELAERKHQKTQLLKKNREEMAQFKVQQKKKRDEAYSALAVDGEEFVNIAKFFLPDQQIREQAEARKALPKMPKLSCKCFTGIGWTSARPGWRIYGDFVAI